MGLRTKGHDEPIFTICLLKIQENREIKLIIEN